MVKPWLTVDVWRGLIRIQAIRKASESQGAAQEETGTN